MIKHWELQDGFFKDQEIKREDISHFGEVFLTLQMAVFFPHLGDLERTLISPIGFPFPQRVTVISKFFFKNH